MALLLFYLALALCVSFLCSILEAVLLSVTPTYIAALDDRVGHKRLLIEQKRDVDSAISSILILNTIAHTMGAAGVGAEATRIFGVEWQTAIAVVLTLLILYVSEIIPKTLGATYWRLLAGPASRIIAFLVRVLAPFLWISRQITRLIRTRDTHHTTTREEISAMAEIGEQSGVLDDNEGQLIENLLDLRDITVGQILTPRSVVFALEAGETIASALEYEGVLIYSRIPIYEGERDNLVGLVFAKTILTHNAMGDSRDEPLRSIMRPIHSVPASMAVYFLLDQFIQRKEHLFAVHDEFKQFSGLVTLEDVIETLLGREIVDELDTVEDLQQLALEKARHFRNAQRARWKQAMDE